MNNDSGNATNDITNPGDVGLADAVGPGGVTAAGTAGGAGSVTPAAAQGVARCYARGALLVHGTRLERELHHLQHCNSGFTWVQSLMVPRTPIVTRDLHGYSP